MSHAETIRELRPWPGPVGSYDRTGKQRYYRCPDGVERVSVTTVEKVLGIKGEALIGWATRLTKDGAMKAAEDVFQWGQGMSTAVFMAELDKRIGEAKAHIIAMEKAADIGTQIHQMIQWYLRGLMEVPPGDEPKLSSEATVGWIAWRKWWDDAGIKPIRVEQVVWDETHNYAGQIDLIGENPMGQLEIWDWKSSNYIVIEHHIQVAAYLKAARNWRPIAGAYIMRVPKSLKDLKIEVKPCGEMWDFGRRREIRRTEAQLFQVFVSALNIYRILMESPYEGS